jgi:hypothetical protein
VTPSTLSRRLAATVAATLATALSVGQMACGGVVQETPVQGGGGAAGSSDSPGAGGALCNPGPYPEPPPGKSPLIHVSAACVRSTGDGSAERPYLTLAAALKNAVEGAAILMAPGDYPEGAVMELSGLAIVGGPTTAADRAPVTLRPAGTPAIVMKSASGLLVQGIHVLSAETAGIECFGCDAAVAGVHVEGARASGGEFGYGIVASEGSTLSIADSLVERNASAGIIFDHATATVLRTLVRSNGGGGIRIANLASIEIEDVIIDDNGGVGIDIHSATATLTRATIRGTRFEGTPGLGSPAFGLVVAPGMQGPSTLTAKDGTVVETTDGIGIYVDGATAGEIRDVIVRENRIGVVVSGPGPGYPIRSSDVAENEFLGLAVIDGGHAVLERSRLRDAKGGTTIDHVQTVTLGHGAYVEGGSSLSMDACDVIGNPEIGLMVDGDPGAPGVSLAGSTLKNNGIGISRQGLVESTISIDPSSLVEQNGIDIEDVPAGTHPSPI